MSNQVAPNAARGTEQDRPSAGRARILAGACTIVLVLSGIGQASDSSRLLAHVMPWFGAKPTSPTWNWHWTMDRFDPDALDATGHRPIASHYRPLIGPYDSGDPDVIEYQLLLMKLAGFDGLIADWYGLSNHFDYPIIHRNTVTLFEAAERIGLEVGVCYEDQTIPRLVEARAITESDRVRHARGEVDWLRRNWFAAPNYLKHEGRPVLLSFGNAGLSDDEWTAVFVGMPDPPVYLSEHHLRAAADGAFDWPIPADWRGQLDRFEQSLNSWPIAMPVAFPRFHDIYAEAGVGEGYPVVPDVDGRTFESTLRRALDSGSPFVQVATWNDWGEGTVIEPSTEFGYRDLELTQRLRRQHIDPGFSPGPDELRLAHRLYMLRKQQSDRSELPGLLDEASAHLASFRFNEAKGLLDRIDTEKP